MGASSALIISVSIFLGFLLAGAFPLSMSIIPQESVLPADRATASSAVLSSSQVGGALTGPLLAGVVAEAYGTMFVIYLALGWAVLAALIGVFLESKRAS